MAHNDYYKTLGVAREAPPEEIRKAYKKLAKKYHPDARPDDKEAVEMFKRVQEAFDVLGDPEKRKHYDEFGTRVPFGAGPQARGQATRGGPIDLSDLFSFDTGGSVDLGDLFGAGFPQGGRSTRAPRRARRGGDLQTAAEIPFATAIQGGEHELQLEHQGRRERISVKIPAGVETGSVIRLTGQGEPAPKGGEPGDLLITIRVAAHPWFRREGNNLLIDLPITVSEAALGAKIDVPTLSEGLVTLTIPPGTSSGARLRLRGKGAPDRVLKQRGDQLVVVKIVVPQKLDARARTLFEELARAAPVSPRAGLW